MDNLPSFLRPLQETIAPTSASASASASASTNPTTSFADFLKTEAVKAGLMSDVITATNGPAGSAMQKQSANCKCNHLNLSHGQQSLDDTHMSLSK